MNVALEGGPHKGAPGALCVIKGPSGGFLKSSKRVGLFYWDAAKQEFCNRGSSRMDESPSAAIKGFCLARVAFCLCLLPRSYRILFLSPLSPLGLSLCLFVSLSVSPVLDLMSMSISS